MIDPASIILACAAIALSVAFFWMSYKMSERVSEATRRIELSVEKLETVFNLQHKETFSMVRTTFDDLRKHAWGSMASEEDFSKIAEEKADERTENIRKEMSEEMKARISEISRKTKRTDAQIVEIKTSMEELLRKAITETKHVEKEIKKETLKDRILLKKLKLSRQGNISMYVNDLPEYMGYRRGPIRQALNILLLENLIRFQTVGGRKRILFTEKGLKKAEEIESSMLEDSLLSEKKISPKQFHS